MIIREVILPAFILVLALVSESFIDQVIDDSPRMIMLLSLYITQKCFWMFNHGFKEGVRLTHFLSIAHMPTQYTHSHGTLGSID